MVHMMQRLSFKLLFKEVVIAEFMFGFFLLIHTSEGQSLQKSQPQLVTAMAGEDVVLPCHLKAPLNTDELAVEWGRLDLNPRFVYLWFDGSEYKDDQNIAYKGRTSLFTERLKDGDVSLRLTGVKHSDNGRFRCYDPKEIEQYFVDLFIGSVSSPRISLAGLDNSSLGVMLDCSSAGWYPEPEIIWLDGEGNIMSVGSTEKTKGPDGLYSVSSRVTVEKRHNNNITCRVQQKDINQTREKHIYIQDDVFGVRFPCIMPLPLSLNAVLGLSLFLLFIILIRKWRQTKILKKRLKDEVNWEKQYLMTEEKDYVFKKKSDLVEKLRKGNQDQRSIDQQIEALMKMSADLKELKERLSDQRLEAWKIFEENDRRSRAVEDEVTNTRENRMEKRAKGYFILKEIITESNKRLTESKADNLHMKLITEKLTERTSQEVKKLKERKQEIENHVVEIEKHLKEIETDM
ncbi:butyrophilin subfamily 3 member A3-like [Cyprinodon tularosa]|uniref:butyrophilin subfamily 3 member A3-like n=1 Tax=Cyprinodon tularosa TaxID=77115 RepID=UPI0018E1F21E|nr:butyrophilin subfamily 3 member A3-like [Cyprinodon tularosa]